MDRRSFLRFGSLAAGTYAFFGCGEKKANTQPEQTKKPAHNEEDSSKKSAETPEREQEFYTSEEPGKWKGKEEAHLPTVSAADGKITLKNNHPMTKDHYITRQQIRDSKGDIIADRQLSASEMPESSFVISMPSGDSLAAISICNLHGTWKVEQKIADLTAGFGRAAVFTKENPGPWAGKEDLHLPALKSSRPGLSGSFILEVATPHVMEAGHYISKHEVKNSLGELLAQSWFNAKADKAAISFMEVFVPPTGVRILSSCNLHGVWMIEASFDQIARVSTAANPSATGDAASHVPKVTLVDTGTPNASNYTVSVRNAHEMVAGVHFISKHVVRTAKGEILAQLTPGNGNANNDDDDDDNDNNAVQQAVSNFDGRVFQTGEGRYSIYAYCNMHGVWKDDFGFDQLNLSFSDTPGLAGGTPTAEKPSVLVDAESITVKNEHPMANDHHIVRHQVRKSDGSLVFERGFLPTSTAAISVFPKTGLAGAYFAYSFCNQHGIWKAPFTV